MSFQTKVRMTIDKLPPRPVFRRETKREVRQLVTVVDSEENETVEERVLTVPGVEILEPDPVKRKKVRRAFRRAEFQQLKKLNPNERFKLSVLVRAVRSGGVDILAMARDTRRNDKTYMRATQEEIVAGIALAETQGVDMDKNWSAP